MKKLFKYILIGFAGLFVLGLVASGSGKDKGSETKTVETKTEITKSQEVQKVEISAFIKEFDENQLSAEAKYKDKQVEFAGYIKNISEDIMGSPFLSINPNADQYYFGTSIQCLFKEKSELVSLKNGQKVKVQGKLSSQSLGIIMVKECSVVTNQ